MTFSDFLRSLGIIPPEQFTPGRWQNCNVTSHPTKKKGRVKLSEDGQIGFAIDYLTMTSARTWFVLDDKNQKIERTAAENAELSERLEKQRQRAMQATIKAAAEYASAEPLKNANHEYLRKKRCDMNGCRGLKVDARGMLIVPAYRDGKLASIQRISTTGEKRFFTNAILKGATFRIWRPGAVAQVLTEGLATGLTVFSACPMAQVIVCFSAANLIAVAEREDFSGMVAIAADNDAGTEEDSGKNPGIMAAQRAAEIIGCGVAIPYCAGTDFNDLFIERLERIEKEDEPKQYHEHPAKLRERSLSPVRISVMAALKKVGGII